jgi:hypothetical protein
LALDQIIIRDFWTSENCPKIQSSVSKNFWSSENFRSSEIWSSDPQSEQSSASRHYYAIDNFSYLLLK